ncbi:MAG: SDR family oxidoreductase [Bacillota bacterium]|nr:SDR family oxidoreductase [Bacillota bacterium]
MKLQEKVLMVTGAASGIGRAAAVICAGYGAKVVAVDLNEEGVNETVEQIRSAGGEAIAVKADTTNRKQIAEAVDAGIKTFGKINCLFNNAGIVKSSFLIDCDDELYDRIMTVNAKGAYIVATEVAKHMKEIGEGRIINTSSISALKEESTNGFYCMSKSAVLMMTHILALELSQYGVTSVAICPGHINTSLLRNSFIERGAAEGKSVDEFYAEMEGTIPMGRLAEPEEIGEFVAFLCDDRSAYISGNGILMAGGKVME